MFRLAFWLVLPTLPMFLIDLAVFHDDDQVFARIFQQLDVGNRITRQPHRSRSSQAKPRWDQPLA
jgi:hypothetical protein